MTQLMREAVESGLLDRIKAAEQRIADNHSPRRIPADPHGDVDLVLAEVRYLIEGNWPPFWIKPALSHLTEELRRQEGRALTDEELADCGLLSGLVEGVKVEPWVRPQECSATGASHHDGPYGPMRQTQCYYCGQPPTAAAQALHTDQAAEGGENACEAPRPKLADLRGLLRSDQVLPRDDTSVEADRGGERSDDKEGGNGS